MCEICGSMLAAEHAEQPGAELCPKCRRFPLDAEAPLDLSQWDYVSPDLQNAAAALAPPTPGFVDSMAEQAREDPLEDPEGPFEEETDEEETEEHVRTCYHCYQRDSGLAELCPVCGDSYLPPALRQPHLA
jgi:hypothetical protein